MKTAFAIILLFIAAVGALAVQVTSTNAIETGSDTIIQEAVKKGDVAICNQIEIFSLRDGCIMSVAIEKNDTKLCDTMSEETKKTTAQDKICKAAVTHDTKYCDEITTYMGVGQEEMKQSCRVWGKNSTNPYEGKSEEETDATATSIITQLKNKLIELVSKLMQILRG